MVISNLLINHIAKVYDGVAVNYAIIHPLAGKSKRKMLFLQLLVAKIRKYVKNNFKTKIQNLTM